MDDKLTTEQKTTINRIISRDLPSGAAGDKRRVETFGDVVEAFGNLAKYAMLITHRHDDLTRDRQALDADLAAAGRVLALILPTLPTAP